MLTLYLVDQKEEAWNGRKALLGAVAWEYPEPFEALEAAAPRVSEEAWQYLGRFAHPMSLDTWLSIRASPSAKEAVELLDAWRATAWKGGRRFPKAWEPWAYPMLGMTLDLVLKEKRLSPQTLEVEGKTFALKPTTLVRALSASLYARVHVYSASSPQALCPEIEDRDFARLLALPKKEVQERLYALFLEQRRRFLEGNPHLARPDPWPTRERDVFLLAWKEVEGLSLEALANRLYDRLLDEHPTARFLRQGGVEGGVSKEAIRKALAVARERLKLG